jgi:hypothetical protein
MLAVALAWLLPTGPAPGEPGPDETMATARANAQQGLALALAELQQTAGPDQRVTARADILDATLAHPFLTGVWNSWAIDATAPPTAADYQRPAKDAKFLGWLVSNPDPVAARQVDFANQPLAAPVTLWGRGTLGETAPLRAFVNANKVPLAGSAGAYAWAVLDEGVKARINTPFTDGATSAAMKTMQLGTGERPGVEFIPGLGGLGRGFFQAGTPEFTDFTKGIGDANFGLTAERLAPGTGEVLKTLTHDISLHSTGLFTDTARGGLREDFQLLTNTFNLPDAYRDKGVYATRLGLASSAAPSDPSWTALQRFARVYRDRLTSSGGVPLLKAYTPPSWQAATHSGDTTVVNRRPPHGPLLLPTIAKVQMLFSLIGRDLYSYPPPAGNVIPVDAPVIHGPQGDYFRGTQYQYDLHLLYTPIVTLHNPYNVAIELNTVRLEFVHVPFAMQVFRGGVAQSTGLVPLETMYADNDQGQQGKVFGMNLKTKVNGQPGSTTFRLLPGEVKLFSAYLDPSRTYRQDLSDRKFWDIYVSTGITNQIDAIPGWRGDGIGYDCNWIAGGKPLVPNSAEGRWGSCVGIARDDDIYVQFAPLSIPLSNNKFVIRMTAIAGTSPTPILVSAIEMNYETSTGLQDFMLGPNNTLRYPKTGTVKGIDLVDHATTPIANILKVKPFALLSVQAKTTSGGRYASNEDGRFATKPWCFANASIGASSQKVISEHSANFSHEIDLQLLEHGTEDLLTVDKEDRTSFISGHTAFNGTKFGGMYDIPLAPVQTLASLNGANPGGSSGYLPRFAQPIGNSWAHPLISPAKLLEPKTGGNYLDHSFLLNLALFDRYYFSGLADQTGPFGTGKSAATLAAAFAANTPLDDPRLLLYRPNGGTAAGFVTAAAQTTAYAAIAAWQLQQGAFNINSTSVPAWKAMLASIHDAQAIFNQLNKANNTSALSTLPATAAGRARFSRFRLPAAGVRAAGVDIKDSYWLGPREYTSAELQTLAENIVKQVRLRGPFLSLAEFVNRRLGSDDTAQRGALQQAIDDSNLNRGGAIAANAGFDIPAAAVTNYKYVNLAAGIGPSYQGAPGFLTQADMLNVLGNAATARSDTFTIRAYGEATGSAGTATATCEMIVQRLPDWVDPSDRAETHPTALVSATNRAMGRRFKLIAFRWLAPGEI